MGFGGGGSGSFVLPNHKHTNVLADGGELEDLVSLVDGATLQAWVTAEIAAVQTTFTQEVDKLTSDFSTTSNTKVAVTGLSVVLGATGQALMTMDLTWRNSTNKNTQYAEIYDGTNDIAACAQNSEINSSGGSSLSAFMTMASETITIRVNRSSVGTVLLLGDTTANAEQQCSLMVIKIT